MRYVSALLALSIPLSTGPASGAERPATKAEITKLAVGHTVSRTMKFAPDGRYTYRGGSPGKYSISNGRICVVFDDGRTRCDSIVTDGSSYFLINAKGGRSPFIPD